MEYTCYVYSEGRETPFMDVFAAEDVQGAIDYCLGLMSERPQALRAEMFADGRLYRTIELRPAREPASSAVTPTYVIAAASNSAKGTTA